MSRGKYSCMFMAMSLIENRDNAMNLSYYLTMKKSTYTVKNYFISIHIIISAANIFSFWSQGFFLNNVFFDDNCELIYKT